jgi:hypothetical protein
MSTVDDSETAPSAPPADAAVPADVPAQFAGADTALVDPVAGEEPHAELDLVQRLTTIRDNLRAGSIVTHTEIDAALAQARALVDAAPGCSNSTMPMRMDINYVPAPAVTAENFHESLGPVLDSVANRAYRRAPEDEPEPLA